MAKLARLTLLLSGAVLPALAGPPAVPRMVLWAWERPEDLRFLDPSQTGVAFLASTLRLHAESVLVRPRMQPLQVPPGAFMIAVFRIETSARARPKFTTQQRKQALEAILETVRRTRVNAVQIDFDARLSERPFYAALLKDLRARLPRDAFLSITALVSWCGENSWLRDLPVDEAVPMLFRMGRVVTRSTDFPARACQGSIGLSTDEFRPRVSSHRRAYIFNPVQWTSVAFRQVERELR